jgi:hypothetical protein
MHQRTNIRRGMIVMSQDGVQLGRVMDVTTAGIVIEKGHFFFLKDFEVPLSDISMVRGDEIILVRNQAELRRAGSGTGKHAATAKGTVGVAGIAAPPPGEGLGLEPTELTEARMDSARFHYHEHSHLQPTGGSTPVTERAQSLPDEELRPAAPPSEEAYHPLPHEPPLAERRAAGPGWDPLSVDEDMEKDAPRTSGPDPKAPTRY